MLSLRDACERSGFVSLSEISKEKNISYAFLEQISKNLKSVGLVVSKRGIRGGYRLALAPQKILLADIFFALEKGEISRCRKGGKINCRNYSCCEAKSVLAKIENEIYKILKKTTLDKI